jgi:hypothetical protein
MSAHGEVSLWIAELPFQSGEAGHDPKIEGRHLGVLTSILGARRDLRLAGRNRSRRSCSMTNSMHLPDWNASRRSTASSTISVT